MGLIHPGFLLLGLGIAVPLILHLFQRHQGPRVIFPALRYLRRAEHESARKVKLRQILLMLLRVAAVLLIAFAAARPFVRAAGIGHEPTAVVIILDNSMSSGAVRGDMRVIDVLKARALESVATGEPEDRFWLLRAGSSDEPAYPGDALETARRIRETEPVDGSADITRAVARARAILAAGAQGRASEIQLLSDLQRSNVLQVLKGSKDDPEIVLWRAPDNTTDNRAISSILVGGGIAPGANERSTLSAVIAGNTPATDSANVRLVIDNHLAAASHAPAGGTAVLQFPARPAGLVTGWVEMDADALRADNRRYFAIRVAQPPVVAASRAAPFVDEALAAMEAAGRIRRGTPQQAQVLILPGGGDNPVMSAGRTIVVFPPESNLEIEAVNRRLASSGIPWAYALQSSAGESRFAIADTTDALFRTLRDARLQNVYALHPTNAARGDSILLRTQDGAPWAVRGERAGGGRYILLASPLTQSASSIPTSAAMLPLLDRMVRTWAASADVEAEAQPGETVTLPAGASAVLRPDTVTEPVTTSEYRVPVRAGIYQVMSGRNVVSAFAVNTPAMESDLAIATKHALSDALPSWRVTSVTDAKDWQRSVFRSRVGREMWRALLVALLAALVVEAIVAASGNGQRATAEPIKQAA